jgi:glycosyltransferase involved in cell wall biosynthesis
MRVSIVIALLNEAEGLERMRERLVAALASLPRDLDWEVILVDDGSTDSSWETISAFAMADRRFRGVRLSRNFGNHAALLAGLSVATGDVAMNLAADLQTPPELVARMCREYQEGADIVFGARKRRVDGIFGRLAGLLSYRIISLLSEQNLPPKGIDVFLLGRTPLDAFLKLSGRNNSILSRAMSLGFVQRTIEYEPATRAWGRSKWTLQKKLRLFADTLLGHSARPLRLCFAAAVACLIGGLAGMALSTYAFGWSLALPHLLSAVLLVCGMQFVGIGLLGEYVFRGLQESASVPVYIVREDTSRTNVNRSVKSIGRG